MHVYWYIIDSFRFFGLLPRVTNAHSSRGAPGTGARGTEVVRCDVFARPRHSGQPNVPCTQNAAMAFGIHEFAVYVDVSGNAPVMVWRAQMPPRTTSAGSLLSERVVGSSTEATTNARGSRVHRHRSRISYSSRSKSVELKNSLNSTTSQKTQTCAQPRARQMRGAIPQPAGIAASPAIPPWHDRRHRQQNAASVPASGLPY